MSKFTLFTDSACDLSTSILEKWDVRYLALSFIFDNKDKSYGNYEMSTKKFYQKMRDGHVAKTSALNADAFTCAFEPELKKGNDVLYLSFSSGLSGTFNASRIAAEELREKYPDRKVYTVDSLCASAGQGLLLRLLCDKRDAEVSVEDAADYVKSVRLHIAHWFTVDDLVYLKRGGRISPTVALVGGILGIKPVLHMDNEGKLVSVSKARGRKAALKAMVEKFAESCMDMSGLVYISHADCEEDAKELAEMVKARCSAEVDIITDIGPVIGAHSGPGTLAIFFVAKER